MNGATITQALRRNVGVVGVCATVFLAALGQGAVSPVLPLFVRDFGVGTTLIGLTISIFGAGRVLTNVPTGFLVQRYGRRLVLVVGPSIVSVGTLLLGLSSSYWQVLLFRAITGAGWGLHFVGVAVYLRDASTVRTRGRYMSLQPLSILVGASIGPLIGGFMAEAWGMRAPFFLMAGLLGVAAVWAFLWIPETRGGDTDGVPQETLAAIGPPTEHGKGVGGPFRTPSFLVMGLFTLMIFFNRSGGRFTILPLFGEDKGLSSSQLGLIFTLTAIPQLLSALGAGAITDKLGRKAVILPASSLIVLGLAAFILGESYAVLAFSAFLLGAGEGLAGPPTAAFFADVAPRGLEGVTMGLYRTFGDVGFLLGPLLLGWLAEQAGFSWSLGTSAILVRASALLLMLVARDTVQRRAASAGDEIRPGR